MTTRLIENWLPINQISMAAAQQSGIGSTPSPGRPTAKPAGDTPCTPTATGRAK